MYLELKHTDLYLGILLSALLSISTLLLYQNIQEDINLLEINTHNEHSSTFSLTKLKIESYLNNLKDKVALISYKKYKELTKVVITEDGFEVLEDIQSEINDQLSNVNRSTLADNNGVSFIPDFDGFIGVACQANLIDFANNKQNPIRIHPNPKQYHFDIMTPFEIKEHDFKGIFFTSFKTDKIVDILKESEVKGVQYYIIHKDYKGLIEVSSEGDRNQLTRPTHLTDSELKQALLSEEITGTGWELLMIIDHNILDSDRIRITKKGITNIVIMCLAASVFFIFLYKKMKETEKEKESHIHSLQKAKQLMKHQSLTDALTMIPNRRSFDERIELEWNRAIRQQTSLSLIIIDIDFFKKYNDQYGHLKGDDCLKKVSQTLSQSFSRSSDFVARYGGEEFIVIIPDAKEVDLMAEFCRSNIEAKKIKHKTSPISEYVTISLGVYSLKPDRDLDLRKFIDNADKALYQAKENGRNQCFNML